MHSNISNGSRAAWARGFVAFFAIMLAIELGAMALSAEAAPFAYVANSSFNSNTVSVIDTATTPPSVVATIPVGNGPNGVAVTPDGKHAYVTILGGVSVIDTATNTVVATLAVGIAPDAVAVTPDGKHAYVANFGDGVSVIHTATNTVEAATIPANFPTAVAVTPDGKHAYVANSDDGPGTVSVVDTASNTVVTTIPVGRNPSEVAVSPDGKHAYVTGVANNGPGTVSVIDTASNTVVATIPVGTFLPPSGIAITPDGKYAYVADGGDTNVSVIDTASNRLVATVVVGGAPGEVAVTPDGKHVYVTGSVVSVIETATNKVVATVPVAGGAVAIVPPPPGVPFLAFGANLVIAFGGAPNQDSFAVQTRFILSSTAPGINPLTQPVTLQAGTFTTTIPPGSFKMTPQGFFVFAGVINGVAVEAAIEHTGTLQYAFQAKAVRASFTGTMSPVYVTLTIGGDSGATSVTALIFH